MAGDGQDKCGRCSLAYNKEERCPRTLVCGHTSCTACLDALIQAGERRCPSCSRQFFSYSTVLIPKDFQVLRRLGELSKSSQLSSYTSPLKLKSSLSVDSSLARSPVSRERFSASSALRDSQTEGSFDIGGSVRPRSEGGVTGLSDASTGVSLPPPPPSSAPPSLDETSNDLQVSRSQVEDPSGVDGGGGGSGGSFSRLSKSSSGDEAAGTFTTPSYSFPAIRTRLSTATSRATDISASTTTTATTTSTGSKMELRPVKSLPPLSSSAAIKSPSISSPLSAEASSSASSSGYTSPFLRTSSSSSSSSSFSSSLNTSTIRSLQSGYKKLSLDSSEETQGSQVPSSLSGSVDSSGLSRSMPSLHKLESKLSVPSGGGSQDEVDLSVSTWKLKTSKSLSRRKYSVTSSSSRQDTSSLRMCNNDTSSTSPSSSSHLRRSRDASRQADTQTKEVRPFARSSGTPTHVLRMCRSITSKTRPAADDEAEVATLTRDSNTSSSSYQTSSSSSSFFSSSSSSTSTVSSSSSSSSSLAASKDSQSHRGLSEGGQQESVSPEDMDMMGMREAGPETPLPAVPPSSGASDDHGHSYSQHSSLASRDDANDAAASRSARVGPRREVRERCDEAEDTSRRSPAASSPSEMRGDKSKEARKLALSSSLSARLGARTGFLSTAIDEENEEDAGGGAAPAGGEVPAGRDGILHRPDRQGVQPSRSRASLGARISARTGYLAGGWSSGGDDASRGEVQAEDSTKIDPQRRAGRSWTKRGAAAGERHSASPGVEAQVGAPAAHQDALNQGTAQGGEEGAAEVKVTRSLHTATTAASLGEAGGAGTTNTTGKAPQDSRLEDREARTEAGAGGSLGSGGGGGGAVIPGSVGSKGAAGAGESREAYSRSRQHGDVLGRDAAPAHELSQHSGPGRHRLIDSRAKEELSDPGCEPRAASARGAANTWRDTREAQLGRAAGHLRLPNEDGVSDPHTGSRGDAERWTKLGEKREKAPPVFRSGTGNANALSDAADGSPGTSGSVPGRETRPVAPPPPSDLFPWKKKWRSVTERTSMASTRHTRGETLGASLSSDSKEVVQHNAEPRTTWQHRPLSTQHSGAAAGGASDGQSSHPSRGLLGTLTIGRVPSFQDDDAGEAQTRVPQDVADTSRTDEAPAGSTHSDHKAGIQAREARDAGERKDVRSASVLKGNKRMSAWLASLSSDEGKQSTQTPDPASQTLPVSGNATEHIGDTEGSASSTVTEDKPDLSSGFRQASHRHSATSITPTEEAPAPARTNLSYLLTRLQNTEVKKTSYALNEDEDEVFYETSEDEEGVNTHQQEQQALSSSSIVKTSMKETENSEILTKNTTDQSQDLVGTTDEPDSTTRRRNTPRDTDKHSDEGAEETPSRHEQEEDQDTDEDCLDAPCEGAGVSVGEYEPGVGLCSSHGLMLHLYCEDCEEWVCDECLKVLHRPPPKGSCRVITAAEGVSQMKVNHESFLASRTNTLDYFRAELHRIIAECDNSINLHGDNLRRLEEEIEEEQRLVRGIESMRSLAKEKLRQVNYWEEVLQKNLSRIDGSSSSSDVISAVRESSNDILQKAMEAVSMEAGAGLLLSPPN
ncbi:serine-rich adhesin for platelets-like [Scylla paramamosain]|uniref:serine-rich adhesin for platelets-like n=1 Tax=Scylla paramamosain TaxID=85552 RepID=UPI0030827E15